MVRTLSGENSKSDMSPDVTNNALMDFAKEKLESEDSVTLIHDPSDIRKPYSTDLEDIGYVRSLDKKIIHGSSTHNIIALIWVRMSGTKLRKNKSYSSIHYG